MSEVDPVQLAVFSCSQRLSRTATSCRRCDHRQSRVDEVTAMAFCGARPGAGPGRLPPASPPVRYALVSSTPDRIRTGATALREQMRTRRPSTKTTECPDQTGFPKLVVVGARRPFSDVLLPQC